MNAASKLAHQIRQELDQLFSSTTLGYLAQRVRQEGLRITDVALLEAAAS